MNKILCLVALLAFTSAQDTYIFNGNIEHVEMPFRGTLGVAFPPLSDCEFCQEVVTQFSEGDLNKPVFELSADVVAICISIDGYIRPACNTIANSAGLVKDELGAGASPTTICNLLGICSSGPPF